MTHALQRLIDKEAIWECSLRYTRGLDRLDIELFRSAYWDDAQTCHGALNGSVDDFLDWWLPMQEARECGQHVMSNQRVEFDSDEEAHVETYFNASIKRTDSDSVEILVGRYVDRFTKRGDDWRIQTRVLIFEWQAYVDASAMTDRLARNHKGTRHKSDISYERPLKPRLEAPVAG